MTKFDESSSDWDGFLATHVEGAKFGFGDGGHHDILDELRDIQDSAIDDVVTFGLMVAKIHMTACMAACVL